MCHLDLGSVPPTGVCQVYFGRTGKNEQLQLSVLCIPPPLLLATRDLNS